MESITILYLLCALFVKHFVIDFPLQGPYQYKNKGTYGHPGGLLHSYLHGLGTWAVIFIFCPVSSTFAFSLGIIDCLIHYHIDCAKMNINKNMGWMPTTHEQFWWLLGFDQLLHALTYLGIVAFII